MRHEEEQQAMPHKSISSVPLPFLHDCDVNVQPRREKSGETLGRTAGTVDTFPPAYQDISAFKGCVQCAAFSVVPSHTDGPPSLSRGTIQSGNHAPDSLLYLLKRYVKPQPQRDGSTRVEHHVDGIPASALPSCREDAAPDIVDIFPFVSGATAEEEGGALPSGLHVSAFDETLHHLECRRSKAMWLALMIHRADFSKCLSFSCGLLQHILSIKEKAPSGRWSYSSFMQRYYVSYHNAHKGSGESNFFPSSTVSQLISIPLLAAQIFSNVVASVTEKYLAKAAGCDPGRTSPSSDVAERAVSVYTHFFREDQRDILIASCTLIAWKLADADATVKLFQKEHLGLRYTCRQNGRRPEEARSRTMHHNEFSRFQHTSHPLKDILNMEKFVFNELHGSVGGPPLWWRIAVEVLRLYYKDYLIDSVVAHSAVLKESLSRSSALSLYSRNRRENAIKAMEKRVQCILGIMHGGLERMMLDAADILLLPAFLVPDGQTAAVQRQDEEGVAQLRRAIVCNPYFGFAVAVFSGAVPLDWVVELSPRQSRERFSCEIARLAAKFRVWKEMAAHLFHKTATQTA